MQVIEDDETMTEQEIRKYLRQIEEENSQTALRSFYNLCFDRFFRIAYYYLHTEEWAQEVVLDVFLKIWERRESLHHIANLEDYFFITIKNASLNYLEKEQRRKDVAADAFDGTTISGNRQKTSWSARSFSPTMSKPSTACRSDAVKSSSVYVKKSSPMPRSPKSWA